MRKLLSLGVLCVAAASLGASSQSYQFKTYVSSSAPTMLNRGSPYSSGCEVDDYGPNAEWCQAGRNPADAGCPVYVDGGQMTAVGAGHRVDANGGHWSAPYGGLTPICCIAETADQVDGGGTNLSEAQ
jgi:hypothetical protein